MKVIQVLNSARKQIDDSAKNEWSDADLLVWYNEGVVQIRCFRPYTLIAADGTFITYVAADDEVNDDVLFAEPEKWIIALTDFIPYRAFSEDSGDKRDESRSNQHWNNFGGFIASL